MEGRILNIYIIYFRYVQFDIHTKVKCFQNDRNPLKLSILIYLSDKSDNINFKNNLNIYVPTIVHIHDTCI